MVRNKVSSYASIVLSLADVREERTPGRAGSHRSVMRAGRGQCELCSVWCRGQAGGAQPSVAEQALWVILMNTKV